MAKKRRSKKANDLEIFGSALDIMLQGGHNQLVTPDFILQRREPLNADIGHLDPKDLDTYNQKYIDKLIKLKAKEKINIPNNLEELSENYSKQRELLSDFHNKAFEFLLNRYDMDASKELKNFDPYIDKIIIRNESEMNLFYDYIVK